MSQNPPQKKAAFEFRALEAQNRKRAYSEYTELLDLLGRLMEDAHAGLSLHPTLPRFEERNPRTLQAALLTRSFKSLNAAINLATRGYYTQALSLLRSVYEDELIMWDVGQNPTSAEGLWTQKWPSKRSFLRIAEDKDAWLTAQGKAAEEVDRYRDVYGPLSQVGHPRGFGVRMEFNAAGTMLEAGPNWDSERCRVALAHALTTATRTLLAIRDAVPRQNTAGDWHSRTLASIEAVSSWIDRNPP